MSADELILGTSDRLDEKPLRRHMAANHQRSRLGRLRNNKQHRKLRHVSRIGQLDDENFSWDVAEKMSFQDNAGDQRQFPALSSRWKASLQFISKWTLQIQHVDVQRSGFKRLRTRLRF